MNDATNENVEDPEVLARSREGGETKLRMGDLKEGIKRIANNHCDFAASRLRVNQGSIARHKRSTRAPGVRPFVAR